MRFAFLIGLIVLPVSWLYALEVKFYPQNKVYLSESSVEHGLNSLVIQNIGILQAEDKEVDVQSVTVEILDGDKVRQSLTYRKPEIEKAVKGLFALQQQGILKLLEFQFPINTFLGKDVVLSSSTKLSHGQAIILPHTVFEVKGQPQSVRVQVETLDSSGQNLKAQGSIPISMFQSAIEYDFPLRGTWYIGASGTLHSHHRWAAMEEFALDILQFRERSKSYKTRGVTSADYFAFGQDVIAVADGTVVETVDKYTDDDAKLKQENETYDQYDQRIQSEQMQSLSQDPYTVAGNYIVIRHNDSEYSMYAHLKNGSVKIKKGDVVKRGQVIGSVGNTGSSTEPHLHFQLQDSSDPLRSRALPARFKNVVVEMLGYKGRQLQSGWIVTAE
jgi:murein DD-endopeptidase MepM/ murein hydrolase activator NlpD